jgi:hypothetical protein
VLSIITKALWGFFDLRKVGIENELRCYVSCCVPQTPPPPEPSVKTVKAVAGGVKLGTGRGTLQMQLSFRAAVLVSKCSIKHAAAAHACSMSRQHF